MVFLRSVRKSCTKARKIFRLPACRCRDFFCPNPGQKNMWSLWITLHTAQLCFIFSVREMLHTPQVCFIKIPDLWFFFHRIRIFFTQIPRNDGTAHSSVGELRWETSLFFQICVVFFATSLKKIQSIKSYCLHFFLSCRKKSLVAHGKIDPLPTCRCRDFFCLNYDVLTRLRRFFLPGVYGVYGVYGGDWSDVSD